MKKEDIIVSFFILISALVIYFFLGVRYDEMSILSKSFISIVSFGLFFASYRMSLYTLSISMLSGFFVFLSLGVSLGKSYVSDSPLSTSIILGPWSIFALTLIITIALIYTYEKMKYKDKYPLLLLILYILIWFILAINVKYYEDWKLENYLTVPFIILIFIMHRWFRLSNLSYFSIFIFMTLHIFGSHYTYAEVPFGFWLSEYFSLGRNHYDRIVHFGFGLFFAYPLREIAMRIGKIKGLWSYYIPIEFVLAFSAIYELIEWGIAIIYGGDLGIAYLGSQGDIWDAQKDMFNAGMGSVLTMLIVLVIVFTVNRKAFIAEFKDSLRVKEKEVLGERALIRLMKKKNN
jgi:putative membrane protein